jgi:hypothetical protein
MKRLVCGNERDEIEHPSIKRNRALTQARGHELRNANIPANSN